MAIVHQAFTFAPSPFHRRLTDQIASGGGLDLRALRRMAEAALVDGSSSMWRALEAMRFDPEWLDDSDAEVSHTTEWYAILLARELELSPSLSNGPQPAFTILQHTLPAIGWNDADSRALIYGDALQSLLASSGNDLFAAEFAGIDQRGGWLSLPRLHHLLAMVRESQPFFVEASPAVVSALHRVFVPSPSESLLGAYCAACEMLQAPINREQSLFLILD